jgi:hypothetical protein
VAALRGAGAAGRGSRSSEAAPATPEGFVDLTAALFAARAESGARAGGAAEVLEADEIVEVGGPEAGPSVPWTAR